MQISLTPNKIMHNYAQDILLTCRLSLWQMQEVAVISITFTDGVKVQKKKLFSAARDL